jgi:hypothetical protein
MSSKGELKPPPLDSTMLKTSGSAGCCGFFTSSCRHCFLEHFQCFLHGGFVYVDRINLSVQTLESNERIWKSFNDSVVPINTAIGRKCIHTFNTTQHNIVNMHNLKDNANKMKDNAMQQQCMQQPDVTQFKE